MLQLVYFVSVFFFLRSWGLRSIFSGLGFYTFFGASGFWCFFYPGVFFFLVWRHVDTIHAEAREDPVLSSKP